MSAGRSDVTPLTGIETRWNRRHGRRDGLPPALRSKEGLCAHASRGFDCHVPSGLRPCPASLFDLPRRIALCCCAQSRLRFAVTLPRQTAGKGETGQAESGRLFVVLGKTAGTEPRRGLGRTGLDSPPAFAQDETGWKPGETRTLDGSAIAFPLASLSALPAGDYYAQSVLLTNRDLYLSDAPGNRYSRVQKVHLDPQQPQTISLPLTERVPDEACRLMRLPFATSNCHPNF